MANKRILELSSIAYAGLLDPANAYIPLAEGINNYKIAIAELATTAQNEGSGEQVYSGKDGNSLRLRSFTVNDGSIEINSSSNELDFKLNESLQNTISSAFTPNNLPEISEVQGLSEELSSRFPTNDSATSNSTTWSSTKISEEIESFGLLQQTSLEETTTSLSFTNVGGYVIASPSIPSSVASFDIVSANAVAGTTVMIYYQGAAIPNFTSETVTNFTPDSFVPNELCLLTIIYHSVAGFTLYVNAPSEGFVKTETVSDASYVVSNLDRGKVIEFDNAGVSTSVELPTGILQGSVIGFVNNTGGILSFTAAGGVTIDAEGLNLATAATAASAISWGNDRFQLIGKLS